MSAAYVPADWESILLVVAVALLLWGIFASAGEANTSTKTEHDRMSGGGW